jgi:cytochrome P450
VGRLSDARSLYDLARIVVSSGRPLPITRGVQWFFRWRREREVLDLFSDEMRRNPFPAYDRLRAASPVVHIAPFDIWMILDYDGVRRALTDHAIFSSDLSHVPGQGNPGEWFLFFDPPRHTRLRALIAKAFTPRVVVDLEPRIQDLSRQLLDEALAHGEVDIVEEFSGPLPTRVIAELLGIPAEYWPRYRRWSDAILAIANTFARGEETDRIFVDYRAVTEEMRIALPEMIERVRSAQPNALLAGLVEAEVAGERLTPREILGFVQLLLVGGQETTVNLINNAILCFLEHPDQLAQLRAAPELLPAAIEEVLRYRSPLQWMPRATVQDVEVHGQVIPAGKLVLPVIGSANRDPRQFPDAGRFDVARSPNPHLAFGHGIHACLGAPLARLEARIALADFLERVERFELATDGPWEPRRALFVHGPYIITIRLT